MLYSLGPIQIDTRPFNADAMERTAGSDFAAKPVVGALKPQEAMGEGDDVLTISGKLLPFKVGGLSQLAMADTFRRNQQALPCQRGDGRSLGWRVIDEIRESHKNLMASGVGFEVEYSLRLLKVPNPGGAVGASVIGLITSLFGALGR